MKMKYFLKVPLFLGVIVLFFSCNKDILDRLKLPNPIGSIRVNTELERWVDDGVSGTRKHVTKGQDTYYIYAANFENQSICHAKIGLVRNPKGCIEFRVKLDRRSELDSWIRESSGRDLGFTIDEPLETGSQVTLKYVQWGASWQIGGDSYTGSEAATQSGGQVTVKSVSSDQVTLSFRDMRFRNNHITFDREPPTSYVIINGDITFTIEEKETSKRRNLR